jgi:hypothetical protein
VSLAWSFGLWAKSFARSGEAIKKNAKVNRMSRNLRKCEEDTITNWPEEWADGSLRAVG